MRISLILVSILAILGSMFFGCKSVFCIISAILCIGIVITDFCIKYIMKKNISSVLRNIILLITLMISMFLLFENGIRTEEYGVYDYNKMTEELYQTIAEGEYDESMEIIEEMEKFYGESDYTYAFRALEMIGEKDYEEALELMESMTDKGSRLYYSLKLAVYTKMEDKNREDEFGRFVEEAANRYPSWTMLQQLMGIIKLHNENYVGAAYYLSRAYEQDKTDINTLYYLGVAHYKNGSYEEAVRFFGEAVEGGADEEISGEILWYLNRLP